MNFDKKFLVAVFAAAAAVTFVITSRRKNDGTTELDERRKRKRKALNLTMKVQIQNLINTQKVFLYTWIIKNINIIYLFKMVEAMVGAVREYIRVRNAKMQIKASTNSSSSITANLSTATITTPVTTTSSSSSSYVVPNNGQTQAMTHTNTTTISNESRRLKVSNNIRIFIYLLFMYSLGKEIVKPQHSHLWGTSITLHINSHLYRQLQLLHF